MDGQKPQAMEESSTSDVPTKTNGDVQPAPTEEQLLDFVVIDELSLLANKEGSTEEPSSNAINKNEQDGKVKSNSGESGIKVASPDKGVSKENQFKENDVVHDNEKNGDSLILTADEDLEPVLSSPKKAIPETTSTEALESKQNAADATTNATTTENSDSSKAPAEKPHSHKPRVIWVSNISKTIKATDLKQYLSKAGKVTTAKIVTDGKRCYGYVLMENPDDAIECVKTLNNTSFDGKNILLSFNKPTKVGPTSKTAEARSDPKKSSNECSRSADSRRPEKRRISSPSKQSAETNQGGSESKSKTDVSIDSASAKPAEKKARSRSRSRDRYIRERNERDRLRRRVLEEERRNQEARIRQVEIDERQREKEFRLEQERRKLDMEREIFEKQKREWARINDERRKLERARLEVEQQRAKLEDDLKKERFKRKSPEMMPSVVSKISDPSKKGMKLMKRDFKSSYQASAPPPPKLGMDFDLGGRKTDERKMGRVGGRKIEVIDRKFYGESADRKKHYSRKPEFEENKPYNMKRYPSVREDEHRTQWSPPMAYGSGIGSSTPRYQDTSMPTQSFVGAAPSRASGYYYHPSAPAQEFPRYDQVSNRKY